MVVPHFSYFQVQLLHGLNRVRGVDSLKYELIMEKKSHTSTWDKNIVLLAKAKKWEDEVIDNEEKRSKGIPELNENLMHFKELEETQRKDEAEVEAYRHELVDAKEKYAQDQEKEKHELDTMTK